MKRWRLLTMNWTPEATVHEKEVNTSWLWCIILIYKLKWAIPTPSTGGRSIRSARRRSSVPSVTPGGDHSPLVIPRRHNKIQVWLYFTWLLGYNKLRVQRPEGETRNEISQRQTGGGKKEGNAAADVEKRIYLKLIVFERRSGARVDLILQALVQISAFESTDKKITGTAFVLKQLQNPDFSFCKRNFCSL